MAAGFKLVDFAKTLARVPKLVVLDIDFTIWPLHVDCYVTPPFKPDGNGGATDRHGAKVKLFKDIRQILTELDSAGIKIAAASSTTDPEASRELQRALGVLDRFHYSQIYPRRKYQHFQELKKDSGVDYKDMLFFDDEYINIEDISSLGVTCFYIEDGNGLTLSRFKQGLEQFSKKK